jgi:hypothetical protein
LEQDGSHSLQFRQRPVHLDRICKAGGSRVADLVELEADRVSPNTPQLPRGREHVSQGGMVENADTEERLVNNRAWMEQDGSHSLEFRQRPVHLDRIRKAGGSCVADLVSVKADRVFPNTPQPPHRRKHVRRGWDGGKQKQKGEVVQNQGMIETGRFALTTIPSTSRSP